MQFFNKQISYNSKTDRVVVFGFVLCGVILNLFYINSVCVNVINVNDYIRETLQFVGPDNWTKSFMFTPTLFLIPPMKLLLNWVNYNMFHFNIFFDMYYGVVGLVGIAISFIAICYNIKAKWMHCFYGLIIIFSIIKWEMIINGTGAIHFLAFALFYFSYYLFDLVYIHQSVDKRVKYLLLLIPGIAILFFAVFYSASYFLVIFATYIFVVYDRYNKIKKIDKSSIRRIIAVVVPFAIYVICAYISQDTRVISNGSIISEFVVNPMFFFKFFFLSFGSEIIGVETISRFKVSFNLAIILGIILFIIYNTAIFINVRKKLYNYSYVPLMLLSGDLINHFLILYSRWGFNSIDYGMSSRYQLQYMAGPLGLLLTFMIYDRAFLKKNSTLVAFRAMLLILLIGNCVTTVDEIKMIPHRRNFYENMQYAVINYKNENDESLSKWYGTPAQDVRKAIKILERNDLNVFYDVRHNKKIVKYGFYDDGWIGPDAGFFIAGGKGKKLRLEGIYTISNASNQVTEIMVNNNVIAKYNVRCNEFQADIPLKDNDITHIRILSNFIGNTDIDVRERSIKINKIQKKF